MKAYKETLDMCQNSLLNCTMAIIPSISYKSRDSHGSSLGTRDTKRDEVVLVLLERSGLQAIKETHSSLLASYLFILIIIYSHLKCLSLFRNLMAGLWQLQNSLIDAKYSSKYFSHIQNRVILISLCYSPKSRYSPIRLPSCLTSAANLMGLPKPSSDLVILQMIHRIH